MKSWTSIPFYLWKNTFKRWLEYPVSPLSKIMLPALLGVLAIIVLTLFEEVERELREQLKRNSAYKVVVEEVVTGAHVPTVLQRSFEEEVLWKDRYGAAVNQLRRPLVSANWKSSQNLPVLTYTAAVEDFADEARSGAPPMAWLLTSDRRMIGQVESVVLGETQVVAQARELPAWIQHELGRETVLAMPVEMAEAYLYKGFVSQILVEMDSVEGVRQFVKEAEAYYRAEKRRVKVVSALAVLENLERITAIQRVVRSLIVLGCGIILAMTLGSVAWLEYRQDAYLLALLKSFGTPPRTLLVHMFLENLTLVLAGIGSVWIAWPGIYALALPKLRAIGLNASEAMSMDAGDLLTVAAAALVGVLLAMVPVAVGLRKPPGLILQ